jgi:hypothetical protein
MTSWGWFCPAGMLAQLAKKRPKTVPITIVFHMTEPPNFFIKIVSCCIKAKFVPIFFCN